MRATLWETSAGALVNLLNSGAPLNKADLYTLTLPTGSVLRWSGSDVALTGNGQLWALGPGLKRGQVSWKVGAEVDVMDLTLFTDATRPVNISGTPLLAYIRAGGLRGARLQLDRAFWGVGATQPVGALLWFSGRVAEVTRLDRHQAQISIQSDLEALTTMVPRAVYQAPCLNTLFDTKCGLVRASLQVSGTVTTATDATRSFFTASGLAQAAGYFSLGTVTFTSGANNGLSRTVRTHNSGGALILLSPLPAASGAGDTFTIVPGCDGLQSTCSGKFSTLVRFRGQPYIPQPETTT